MGQLGHLSPSNSVAVGVAVGLISTSVQSLGLTLQRKSHILEDEKGPPLLRRPPYRRRRWQLGMSMFIISNVLGSTIQITTLPLPVLSTLQASGLVFNTICATLILHEAFTWWSLVGTVLVCIGAMLIAVFGAMKEPAHSLDELLQLLGHRSFIVWMVGQAIVVSAVLFLAKLIKMVNPKAKHTPRKRLMRGIAYGCVSGFLSAHSLLLAKSAVELLVRSIFDRANQFNRWQSWMILLGLVVFCLTQLYYLHRGLKLCSTSVLYPLVFCVYNITAILDGLIYFRQTSQLSVLHALLIALGTIILLTGVFALSWRLDHHHHHHHHPPGHPQPILEPKSKRSSTVVLPTSALSPGLGFVDDMTDDDDDEDSSETLIANGAITTTSTQTRSRVSSSSEFLQQQQRQEVAEIWDDLEDGSPTPTPAIANDDDDDDDKSPTESTSLLQPGKNRITEDNNSSRLSENESRTAAGVIWRWSWWKRWKRDERE